MCSKKAIFVLFTLMAIQQSVAARTWRPSGQATIKGDFSDVVGANVSIQTPDGIKTVRYADLSPTDQAVVKSSLESMGRANEAMQLDCGATGESGLPPLMGQGSAEAILPGGQGGNNRMWTDIAGNQLLAEFVGVQGPNVNLRAAGETKSFPIKSFSRADQEWIAAHGGPGVDDPVAGGSASEMSPGHDAYPPSMPPYDPIGTPPGMPPSGGYPGGSMSGGHSAENPYVDSSPYAGSDSAMPSSSNSVRGSSPFRSPGMPLFEWKYKCRNCGAVFSSSEGLKEDDPCPRCSPGASRRSGYSGGSSGGGGRIIGGSIALFALIMGFIGWMVRQVFS